MYYGNSLINWLGAAVSFVLWFTVLPLVRGLVLRRLRKLHPQQSAEALELALALLGATTRLFLVAVAAWLSLRWLQIPSGLDRKLGYRARDHRLVPVRAVGRDARDAFRAPAAVRVASGEGAASLNILKFVGILLVWVVALLMLLANLGVKIVPLVAGLGIGGIAIALAVQNVLGDLLVSLSIALDKPFKFGDFLVIGEEKGRVQQIGIKSTRLRATDRRADRHVEWRPAEEPAQARGHRGGTAGGAPAPDRL